MSWLYIPGVSAASSRTNGSSDCARSAMSKLTAIARKSCSRGSRTGSSMLHLFGMMSKRSMRGRGVEEWILSLADSLASRSPWLERAAAPTTRAIAGRTPSASYAKRDRVSHSWKMCQASCRGKADSISSDKFFRRWPKEGLMSRGCICALQIAERRTFETDCGYWPTPRASPNENRQTRATPSQLATKHGMNLATAVNIWPTMTAGDASRGPTVYSRGNPSLLMAIVTHAKNSRPLCEQIGGTLNPQWVEWFMGWPVGWTDLRPLETDKFRQWLHAHLQFCFGS